MHLSRRTLLTAATGLVAGRTDAGVHATGQVAHADVPAAVWSAPAGDLVRRLAGVLPADVRVRSAWPAPPGFDARFSALWRRYAYRVTDDPAGADPLRRHDTLAWPRSLDLDVLTAASAGLLGEHDFAAYCRRREGATTIRTLQQLGWTRGEDGVLTAAVRADAFCHSMVRSLVGASIAVGEGKLAASDLIQLRDAEERTSAFKVAPAKGLTLVEVGYPPDEQLAARALQTRARRDGLVRMDVGGETD